MSIANLHSIFNRPWYIEEKYAAGHFHLVMGILKGNTPAAAKERPALCVVYGQDGHVVNMAAVNQARPTGQKVVVLGMKEPIVKHDQFCGPQGTKSMMRELDGYMNNPDVAGVVLDIDSGGGQAYGTPEFYDYIKNYPKPVVTYTDGLMCSAAYYAGSGAKHIVVNQRAEAIGSIGAYAKLMDLDGYYESQGAKVHTLYATQSTEKNKAYREAMQGSKEDPAPYQAYIKEDLDPLVATFINDMKSARPQINEQVFKGATYNGPKAVDMGLADEIGTLATAINKVIALANEGGTNVKNTSKMKNYTKVQQALGLETAFESNDNGVYLNEAQLDALEAALTLNEGLNATAADELVQAQDALAAEISAGIVVAGKVAALAAKLDAAQGETILATLYNIDAAADALLQSPGDQHTTAPIAAQQAAGDWPTYVDKTSSIYQQLN